jgi:hypothetical protein
MAELNFNLHAGQLEIFNDPARFKVVAAGRRFGKSFLAAVTLILEALKDEEKGYDLRNKEVYYIAPTFEQAKKIMWPLLKMLAKTKQEGGVIESTVENVAVMTLVNGRRISIKGADRPDSLRGVGLSFAVLDEYAFMKGDVWELIIRPALSDVEGGALFIGTPDGKNHFYELWCNAREHKPGYEDWNSWQFESTINPTLSRKEIALAKAGMSIAAAQQEFGASFNSGGGIIFLEKYWKFGPKPYDADCYIAVDLAGFSTEGTVKKGVLKMRDEHSMTVAWVNTDGWWIEEIIHGQWDVRETAVKIINAYRTYRPVKLGIEKGITKNAVMPYLDDEMKRYSRYFTVWELSHGGKQKADRIKWALQGRLEKGRLVLNDDTESGICPGWQRKLIEQANDFPSRLSHDDLLDSTAYIDQLADVVFYNAEDQDIANSWEPLDIMTGF